MKTDNKNQKIDLLLVVNMFLTGFDSPLLNTLYLDKELKYHNLIQAFSRTIRKHDKSKKYGNIYCFQTKKKDNDQALLFNEAMGLFDPEHTIKKKKSYEELKLEYKDYLKQIRKLAPNVKYIEKNIMGYTEKEKKFIDIFDKYSKIRNIIRIKTEFEEKYFKNEIDKEEFLDYKNKRDKIKSGTPQNTSNPKDEIKHVGSAFINLDYINKLISSFEKTEQKIHKSISSQQNKNFNKEIKNILDENNNDVTKEQQEFFLNKIEDDKIFSTITQNAQQGGAIRNILSNLWKNFVKDLIKEQESKREIEVKSKEFCFENSKDLEKLINAYFDYKKNDLGFKDFILREHISKNENQIKEYMDKNKGQKSEVLPYLYAFKLRDEIYNFIKD